MASYANDFEKLVQEGRERKRNEDLADKIFSKDRRQSAPLKQKPAVGGSLASRVGVKKRTTRASLPAGSINGEWTHDLHDTVSHNQRGGSLSSRITVPGTKKATQRKNRLANALDSMDVDPQVQQQVNVLNKPSPAASKGLTIKGLAGPFTVQARNFAPGTTLADIESAMAPIGGEIVSCHFVQQEPPMTVELVFSSREGGEKVIATFNNKTADGRLIKVYPKPDAPQPGKGKPNRNDPPPSAPSGPRSSGKRATNGQVIDGTMGFFDTRPKGPANGSGARPLYSDSLVNGNNRRGRGFPRGRGGR